jgi:hypothetical protein
VLGVRGSEESPIARSQNLPAAGERNGVRQLARVTNSGAVDPGQERRRPTDRPCHRGTVPVHHCLPGDRKAYRLPAAETGSVRFTSQGLRRRHTEAASASSEQLGGAVRSTDSGTWIGGHAGLDQCRERHRQPGHQVIRNLGRSTRNAGWPYFDGTFRDYPAFKRKFASFRANYHRGTTSQELVQQFREMCLPEKIPAKLKTAETMETAWMR